MNKVLRITDLAKQLFPSDKLSSKAGEILDDILTAKSPRISEIAAAMKGKYEAATRKSSDFWTKRTPKSRCRCCSMKKQRL